MAARATTARTTPVAPNVEVDFDLDQETFEPIPDMIFNFGGRALRMVDPAALPYLETSEQDHPTEIIKSVMSEEDFDHLMAQNPSGSQVATILERFQKHFRRADTSKSRTRR